MSEAPQPNEAGNEARRKNQAIKDDAQKLASDVTGAAQSGPAKDVQADLTRAQGDMNAMLEARRQQLEGYVRQSPWQALGIAFGVGYLLALMRRR
ncbi:MAG TPA: DUF883 C-terminal domain-containing protein [Deinococcales bacterium]|nr:DUF883 C-terminal domain-containing protein [Deinococcales bacterium]